MFADQIFKIVGMGMDSNVYIIEGENPAIVDTGTGFHSGYIIGKLKESIEPGEARFIILTHEHFDHCGGVKKIKKICKNAKILIHEKGKSAIEEGLAFSKIDPSIIDGTLIDGEIIDAGSAKWEVIHTPGHSPGGMCLYDEKSKSLISGDTVFSNGGFGRCDLGGNIEELFKSIKKLSELDVSNLYPGHGPHVMGNGNEHIEMALEMIKLMI